IPLLTINDVTISQPRQVFLEGIINGNGTQPYVVIPASQSNLLSTTTSMVQGSNGPIPNPGVPQVVPANTGTVQVGTTLMVLPSNGSIFQFLNQSGTASITPIAG
ncbi:hypothetical protein PENTCL1PPCAC_6885, partial [Pristionchus entomophagus]